MAGKVAHPTMGPVPVGWVGTLTRAAKTSAKVTFDATDAHAAHTQQVSRRLVLIKPLQQLFRIEYDAPVESDCPEDRVEPSKPVEHEVGPKSKVPPVAKFAAWTDAQIKEFVAQVWEIQDTDGEVDKPLDLPAREKLCDQLTKLNGNTLTGIKRKLCISFTAKNRDDTLAGLLKNLRLGAPCTPQFAATEGNLRFTAERPPDDGEEELIPAIGGADENAGAKSPQADMHVALSQGHQQAQTSNTGPQHSLPGVTYFNTSMQSSSMGGGSGSRPLGGTQAAPPQGAMVPHEANRKSNGEVALHLVLDASIGDGDRSDRGDEEVATNPRPTLDLANLGDAQHKGVGGTEGVVDPMPSCNPIPNLDDHARVDVASEKTAHLGDAEKEDAEGAKVHVEPNPIANPNPNFDHSGV